VNDAEKRIICGDALEVLQTFDYNVFDAIVCDPPCGISFMSAKWDSDKGGRDQWIAWLTSIMKEALRVLKPGGHCLVWALPRTSHWTATALENAGFELRDVIHHMYSADTALQGFLASLTVEQHEAFERLVESQGSSVLYALFGQGFPKSLDVSKSIDAHFNAEREVMGEASHHSNFRKAAIWGSEERGRYITAPATDAAKQYAGFGSNLKPAAEHWILCRKPLSERNIAKNALKWGVGALNIDASRVGANSDDLVRMDRHKNPTRTGWIANSTMEDVAYRPHNLGRFPSHLLLSHSLFCTDEQCFDGCPVLALDQQSGVRKSGGRTHVVGEVRKKGITYGGNSYCNEYHIDRSKGTASRYFAQFRPDVPPFYYTSKASQKERNAGCEALPSHPGFDKNTSSTIAHVNPETGETTYSEYKPSTRHNHHPTVKPLKLVEYLCKLVCPPNGIILDMFSGSGTTGVAAVHCGFRYVLIEQSSEYVEIMRARIEHAQGNGRRRV
jgi:site-specific DNA-methyltransferase (adenine-specific)